MHRCENGFSSECRWKAFLLELSNRSYEEETQGAISDLLDQSVQTILQLETAWQWRLFDGHYTPLKKFARQTSTLVTPHHPPPDHPSPSH